MTVRDSLSAHLAKRQLSPGSRAAYRSKVSVFERFAGPSVKCSDVDEKMLAIFAATCAAQGAAPGYVQQLCNIIRMLLQAWNAAEFATRFPRNVRQVFIHSAAEDTLDCAFVNSFRRGRRIKARRTVRQYGVTLRLFAEHLARPARLDDLCRERVGAFLTWLETEHKATRRTAANHAQRLGAMWRWAVRERLVADSATWH